MANRFRVVDCCLYLPYLIMKCKGIMPLPNALQPPWADEPTSHLWVLILDSISRHILEIWAITCHNVVYYVFLSFAYCPHDTFKIIRWKTIQWQATINDDHLLARMTRKWWLTMYFQWPCMPIFAWSVPVVRLANVTNVDIPQPISGLADIWRITKVGTMGFRNLKLGMQGGIFFHEIGVPPKFSQIIQFTGIFHCIPPLGGTPIHGNPHIVVV